MTHATAQQFCAEQCALYEHPQRCRLQDIRDVLDAHISSSPGMPLHEQTVMGDLATVLLNNCVVMQANLSEA